MNLINNDAANDIKLYLQMKMHSDEIDESRIFPPYLTKLLVSPYRNVSYTNNRWDHYVLKMAIIIMIAIQET